MAYTATFDYVGSQGANQFFVPDTTQRMPLGTKIGAADPYWGGGEFIYLKANGTLAMGNAVQWAFTPPDPHLATAAANSANLARPLAFAIYSMTTGQFGWFQTYGNAVANSNAGVAAAAAIGIVAAGQLGATSAGKELIGGVSVLQSNATVVKTANTQNGSKVLYVPSGYDGWFLGVALTGTGMAGSTVISGLDPDGKRVTLNNAMTATGSASITGTYNDGTTHYNIVSINNPTVQGRIT